MAAGEDLVLQCSLHRVCLRRLTRIRTARSPARSSRQHSESGLANGTLRRAVRSLKKSFVMASPPCSLNRASADAVDPAVNVDRAVPVALLGKADLADAAGSPVAALADAGLEADRESTVSNSTRS